MWPNTQREPNLFSKVATGTLWSVGSDPVMYHERSSKMTRKLRAFSYGAMTVPSDVHACDCRNIGQVCNVRDLRFAAIRHFWMTPFLDFL